MFSFLKHIWTGRNLSLMDLKILGLTPLSSVLVVGQISSCESINISPVLNFCFPFVNILL